MKKEILLSVLVLTLGGAKAGAVPLRNTTIVATCLVVGKQLKGLADLNTTYQRILRSPEPRGALANDLFSMDMGQIADRMKSDSWTKQRLDILSEGIGCTQEELALGAKLSLGETVVTQQLNRN